MHALYLLESLSDPSRRNVGLTTQDVGARLREHNDGKSVHTNKFRPWKCVVHIAFEDRAKAEAFEIHIKHGSGHAFAKRHFY